jgi:uncharacterized protein YkwD
MVGNYIDLIIIFYLAIALLGGLKKRNSDLLLALVSVSLGLGLAFVTYRFTSQFLGTYFQLATAYANVIGFFLNALLFKFLLGRFFARLYAGADMHINPANLYLRRLLNLVLSLSYGLLGVFFMLSIFAALTLPGIMVAQIDNSQFGSLVKRDPLRTSDRFAAVFGDLLTVALHDFSFMDIKTGSKEKVDLGFQTLQVKVDEAEELKMLEMVNKERTSRGLKSLVMEEEARRAARDYGQYLFKTGVFSHIDLEGKGPGDRMKNYNVSFMMAGENLAYAPRLEDAHKGLMNSQSHRDNILHPFFSRVGIGVIDGGNYGKIFVQEFLD